MRFFTFAAPLFLALTAAASPIAVEKKSVAVVEARQNGLDLVSTLNGLSSGIAQQGAVIQQNPTDEQNVAGGLGAITDLLEQVIGLLQGAGADTDPSQVTGGLGGLGGLLGGLLGKRDFVATLAEIKRAAADESIPLAKRQDLDAVGTALQGVLSQLQIVVSGLPAATILLPLVGPLVTGLTPLLITLVAGVNSLVPGLINLVKVLLITVSGFLLSLSA